MFSEKRSLSFILAVLVLAVLSNGALAANLFQDNAENSLWCDANNWSEGHIPEFGEQVRLQPDTVCIIDGNCVGDDMAKGENVQIGHTEVPVSSAPVLRMVGGEMEIRDNQLMIGQGPDEPGVFEMVGGSLLLTNAKWRCASNGAIAFVDISGGTIEVADKAWQIGYKGGLLGVAEANVVMTDGTVDVHGNILLGNKESATGILNMQGGTITGGADLQLGNFDGGTGIVNMTAGQISVDGNLEIPTEADGNGELSLYGGTISASGLTMHSSGSIDLGGTGTIILDGDDVSQVNGYIADGLISAFGIPGRGLEVSFDDSNGVTYVKAVEDFDAGKAWNPSPFNGDAGVSLDTELSWSPGDFADEHTVYLSTDLNDVDGSSAVAVSVNQPGTVYEPDGDLLANTEYFWRVDEVNDIHPNSPWKGDIWGFTTGYCFAVDDFEDYADTPDLSNTWTETGATDWWDLTLSTSTANNSAQAMRIYYNTFDNETAEAVREFATPQDWLAAGAKSLGIWYYGSADNDDQGWYVKLEDNNGNTGTMASSASEPLVNESWDEWIINLADPNFSDVNLASIKKITIGFNGSDPADNNVWIDDVRVCLPRCISSLAAADFAGGDCFSDFSDLEVLANHWLESRGLVNAETPAGGPVVHYSFDDGSGTIASDETGNYDATVSVDTAWSTDCQDGNCLSFDADQVSVDVPNDVFSSISDEITISFWAYGDESQPTGDGLVFAAGPDWLVIVRVPTGNGGLLFTTGPFDPDSDQEDVDWSDTEPSDYSGQWNHYAFVKDAVEGIMEIYRNGELVGREIEQFGAVNPGTGIGDVTLGAAGSIGWGAQYLGRLDDLRVYDYALEQSEILSLAGISQFDQELIGISDKIDAVNDEQINLADFASFAEYWLQEDLWP